MNNDELRDKLLELELYPEDLKNRLREEIIHVRERPGKPWERPFAVFACVLSGLFLIGAAIFVATHLDYMFGKVPTHILVGAAVAVVLLCCLIVIMLLSLKRGTWRQWEGQLIVYGGAAFVLYMFVASLIYGTFIGEDTVDAVDLGAGIVAAVCVIVVYVDSTETRLREHLLRNELAIVKLTELIAGRPSADRK